ncbi:thioredoxin family protein [Stenotrophomonas sp. TWI410]
MNTSVPSWVGKVEEVNAMGFNRIARSTADPLLLYIGAPWCPPCKTMEPAFATAAEAMGTKARFLKVNAATDPQLLDSLRVAAVPMLLMYDDQGREVGRLLGSLSATRIALWAQKRLDSAGE